MNILTLISIEFKKIRRSHILPVLLAAVLILWVFSVAHADTHFDMGDVGISPENSFLVQGFLGMSWFLFPASMVVGTVLLIQNERSGRGMLKMLSLPVSTPALCLAKFTVLLALAAIQILMHVAAWFLSALVAGHIQHYSFLVDPLFALSRAGILYLSAIPMTAFFWMLAVCIRTPVFSVGAGLASIVPSVLIMNTKAWFLYPMCYPFYVMTAEYGKLASRLSTWEVDLVPWIPVAVLMSLLFLAIACFFFGRAERR